MDRKTIRLLLVQKEGSEWMQVHFCQLLQRGAEIVTADPGGQIDVNDVADLWFPVPLGTNLFEAVEFILTSHKIAHHLVHLSQVQLLDSRGSEWEAIFSPF